MRTRLRVFETRDVRIAGAQESHASAQARHSGGQVPDRPLVFRHAALGRGGGLDMSLLVEFAGEPRRIDGTPKQGGGPRRPVEASGGLERA